MSSIARITYQRWLVMINFPSRSVYVNKSHISTHLLSLGDSLRALMSPDLSGKSVILSVRTARSYDASVYKNKAREDIFGKKV